MVSFFCSNEVFELGASNMEVEKRGHALEKWRKRQRAPHEMLQKWQTETKKQNKDKPNKSYPELMHEVYEEKAEKFVNEVSVRSGCVWKRDTLQFTTTVYKGLELEPFSSSKLDFY